MQSILKNKVSFAVVVALVVIASIGVFVSKVSAQPSTLTVQTTATATTTVSYLTSGTGNFTYQIDSYPTYSSSKVFSMAGIDSVYLYAQVAASSTATTYTFQPQYSNNGVDWYNAGSQGTASGAGVVAVATSTTFTWQPGTVATTSMMFRMPDLSGLHQRIITSASGGAGAVYEEVVLKKNAQGE